MLQNKIYQNFLIEIAKNFIVILFGLSIIALTVRAINFLELIVDSGYPIITYFKYSFLNFLVVPKVVTSLVSFQYKYNEPLLEK